MAGSDTSRLISLGIPSVLDLRNGPLQTTVSASVSDPDGVDQVTVYYDRPLSTERGSYSFQIIHGYGSDWSDGQHSYTTSVLPLNVAGDLNITHVQITDGAGNRTIVSDDELRSMGIDTSITVKSTDADITPPVLTDFALPDVVDVTDGSAFADFFAAGSDRSEIDQVTLWFSREINYTNGNSDASSFNDWPLLILFDHDEDDWTDGQSTQSRLIGSATASGIVRIESVDFTDIYGNKRTYFNEDLRRLGFDDSFEVIGTDSPPLRTYVDLPETIRIREGESIDVPLQFVGMTQHYGRYEYYVTTSGGTASGSDISSISGSGYVSNTSTSPTSQTQHISISAVKDGITEPTETGYLAIRFQGNMTFADGNAFTLIPIEIVDDNLTLGGAGKDTLHGTSEAEILRGGKGNDRYILSVGDSIVEMSNEGDDTAVAAFSHALSAHVENLVLTGSADINGRGNSEANRLIGNAGSNILNGGLGADTMRGGAGNDVYIVDTTGDRVIETANAGTDMVRASVSHVLSAHVENLVLTGSADINGRGNSEANRLIGNAGSNILNGGLGADTMRGGAGNDVYIVDTTGDRVIETANAGTDTVRASVSHVLAANVENLVLIGKGDLNGVGNSGANRLTGTAGNNTLNGGAGADTLIGGAGHDVLRGAEGSDILIGGAGDDFLMGGGGRDRLTGGAGADHFIFEPAAGMVGRDVIADFSRLQGDKIDLSRIDANTDIGGNQAFDFIGSGAFSGAAGELRSQLTKTSLIVLGDIDGDRRADFSIELALKDPLFHSDFLL